MATINLLLFVTVIYLYKLTGTLKRRERKRRERKTRHQVAGVEKARTENAAPSGRGGNGENGKRGTKVQGWKWWERKSREIKNLKRLLSTDASDCRFWRGSHIGSTWSFWGRCRDLWMLVPLRTGLGETYAETWFNWRVQVGCRNVDCHHL